MSMPPTRSYSTVSAIADWLKPPRGEAIARLRTNSLGLFTITVLTYLLPLPSPLTALTVLRQNTSASSAYYGLCAFEASLLAVLCFNVLQASYALRYPRPTPPPTPRPSPAKALHSSPPPRQWHLNSSVTPTSSPQHQKSFTYAASPMSTPSRIINYTIPPSPSAQFDSSFTSTVGSVPGSPASPLAAYRGRHSTMTGRAFDGSLLSRLAKHDSDIEDDD